MCNLKRILRGNALIIVLSILSPFILSPIVMAADHEGNVSATVQVTNVSLTITNGSFDYGTLSISDTEDTTVNGLNISTPVITNKGNVAQNFKVKGQNSSSAGAGWGLESSPAAEKYAHSTCIADCDTDPIWTALTTENAVLASNIAKDATVEMDLQIETPTSTTDFNQQTVIVDVQAVVYEG